MMKYGSGGAPQIEDGAGRRWHGRLRIRLPARKPLLKSAVSIFNRKPDKRKAA